MSQLTLYIIGVKPDGPVKIGATGWIERRLQNLRSGSPWDLSIIKVKDFPAKHAVCLEKILHHILKKFRMNGEWFSCSTIVAEKEFSKLMKLTSNGTKLEKYVKLIDGINWNGQMAQLGANASVEARMKKSREACDKIKDRWPLPNSEWSTSVLLKEVDLSYNTAIKFLGKRPIAQYNYQAKLKRQKLKEDRANA